MKRKNVIIRRIRCFSYKITNILKAIFYPLYGAVCWQFTNNHPSSNKNLFLFRVVNALKMLIIYVPFNIIYLFSKTRLGRWVMSPFLPKLGVFFQHPPRYIKLYTNESYDEVASSPTISIVTPSFNQAEFIERTIKSVLNQRYPKLQYVIQDGGSSDGTVDILKKYACVISSWESCPDKGQTNALNLGFSKLPEGEIMAYLNSDDLLMPGSLQAVKKFFAENPSVDVIYGNRVIINEADKCIGQWVLHGHDNDILSYADYIPQETMFWRRDLWDKIGGHFDEEFNFAMDWDLILRFRSVGANFAHMPRFLGAFRVHQSQKTMLMINDIGNQEMDLLRIRELGYNPVPHETFYRSIPFLIRHVISDFKVRYIDRVLGR